LLVEPGDDRRPFAIEILAACTRSSHELARRGEREQERRYQQIEPASHAELVRHEAIDHDLRRPERAMMRRVRKIGPAYEQGLVTARQAQHATKLSRRHPEPVQ